MPSRFWLPDTRNLSGQEKKVKKNARQSGKYSAKCILQCFVWNMSIPAMHTATLEAWNVWSSLAMGSISADQTINFSCVWFSISITARKPRFRCIRLSINFTVWTLACCCSWFSIGNTAATFRFAALYAELVFRCGHDCFAMFVFLLAPCAYTKVPVSGALVGSLPLVSTHKELMANTGLHLISLGL